MKNTKSRGILVGAALLGVTSMLGFSQTATAAPRREVKQARKEVREAKKEVRQEQRDVRKADTRSERRDARGDLRDAKGDLRDARQDLRREQREVRRDNRSNTTYRYSNNRRYVPARRPVVTRRNWNDRRDFRTLQGRIAEDLNGDSFLLRTSNGRLVRVFLPNEPDRLDEGDYVRVYGYSSGGVFHARSFNILSD